MKNDFKILTDTFRKSKSDDLYFTFFKGSLLVKRTKGALSIPVFDEVRKLKVKYENEFFLGELAHQACFCIEASSEINLLRDFELIPLYEIGKSIGEELFLVAGRASQILNWNNTHKFCGKCGSKTENKKDEIAKVCPNCNHVMYPVICPAIIVAVTKGDKILLAHNGGFRNNMYSLIAGFVEAGEDLKSTVKREVFEEVGIKIKNIRYYKSAPWSFPNSLMIGFFAEYESGKIKVDGKEILKADWFTKDTFPNLPQNFSLARKIIDEFIDRNVSQRVL
ncbi:NAD+ diphosphatase [Clostridium acidisoli DSM 12555]|jgi:NAD+ diphosphatase|uniref:NAD(+) diphosphatase n=1 Tax=Clostridium acidisoli DSM 12555 TaxID=1121291 RepID=A0A1W1XRA9_9CLOT|nr:NAD(+) diphosphatase [Clostridium acidisoli]SMC26385.1 NAD+ diphosphatase [Clostridium acidisoli DSM 12555]